MPLFRFAIFVVVFQISTGILVELRAEGSSALYSMDNQRLDVLINRIDKHAEGGDGQWRFKVQNQAVIVITDENADRMRVISPITQSGELDSKRLQRLMQANFDSALDARYSIAKEILWSAYIHPLTPLTDKEFLSAVGQVVNLAATYGTTFTSGMLIFQPKFIS